MIRNSVRVLWVTNIISPSFAKMIGVKESPFGGWLHESSRLLSEVPYIQLSISTPFTQTYRNVQAQGVDHHTFCNESDFCSLLDDINPDIVHIFGTELDHSFFVANRSIERNIPTVLSIQGLVSVISSSDYLSAGLPFSVVFGATLRNLLKKDSILFLKAKLKRIGIREQDVISRVKNIIGRTSWDKECVYNMNRKANYYHCNEILRNDFYTDEKWELSSKNRNRIFLSQGHYPLKGLHYLLEALALVKEDYPDVYLTIGGRNIIDEKVGPIYARTRYATHIKGLITKLGLNSNVEFKGEMTAAQVKSALLESHLSLCCSTLENSPNSIGEAMVLGVPIVASYVGGIPDILTHEREGVLYPHNSIELLSFSIKRVLSDDSFSEFISKSAAEKGRCMHDRDANTERLLEIYKEITN